MRLSPRLPRRRESKRHLFGGGFFGRRIVLFLRLLLVHTQRRIILFDLGKPYSYKGKEILYPNPGFPIYESAINYTGAKSVPYELTENRGFSFSKEGPLDMRMSQKGSMAADLVNFASTIPIKYKHTMTTSKWILKKAMEEYLPKKIIYRPKTGFGVPLRSWINNEIEDLIQEILSKRSKNVYFVLVRRRILKIIGTSFSRAKYTYSTNPHFRG